MKRSRRHFLRWAGSVGLAGLAGCNANEPSEATPTEAPTPTPTTSLTRSPTTTPTSTERPAEESCAATEPETPSSDNEWWPKSLHDHNNTQHNPETIGPRDEVGARWRFETGGEIRSSPVVANGSVYVGSQDGQLYALDMVTGDKEWALETGGAVVSSPSVVDEAVYIGSTDGSVYAVDTDRGEQLWRSDTGATVRSSPTVEHPLWRDSGVLAIGNDAGTAFILNAKTGEQEWRNSAPGSIVATPLLTYERGGSDLWVEFGTTSGESWGHDVGRDSWFRWRDADGPIHSSISAAFGQQAAEPVYYGADDGIMRKRVGPGEEGAWDYETGGKIRSSPAITENPAIVYFGSHDNLIYAVDAENGEQRWTYETDGRVESSPAATANTIYVGSEDNHIYAIDAETGEEMWNFRTGGSVVTSPAVVNGSVFVGSDDGHVYALTACQ